MANLAVRMGSACCVFGIGIGLVVQAAVNARLGEKLGTCSVPALRLPRLSNRSTCWDGHIASL
jgi:hypothetical protein